MQDASTQRKRFLRVTQGFETSRLENGLLAVAYERAVPTVSRRVRRIPTNQVVSTNVTRTAEVGETDVQLLLAKEGQVA